MVQSGELNVPYAEAEKNYVKAIDAGLLKILSKMGISTLQSYIGGQVYEAVGLSTKVMKYFKGFYPLLVAPPLKTLKPRYEKESLRFLMAAPKPMFLNRVATINTENGVKLTYYHQWLFINCNKQLIEMIQKNIKYSVS